MQLKVIIILFLHLLLFTGCQQNLQIQPTAMSLPKKFLVINKKSLDNKQNITQEGLVEAIIQQLSSMKRTKVEQNLKRKITLTDNKVLIHYKYLDKPIAQYSFHFLMKVSNNAYTLTFKAFEKEQYNSKTELSQYVHNNFNQLYNQLDKIHFSKKRVLIFVNNFPTLLSKKELTQKLEKSYALYKAEKYSNIYMIPFNHINIPTYIEYRSSTQVHLRSYIPYTMNTKSGANLSSYQRELFKHKLKNIIAK